MKKTMVCVALLASMAPADAGPGYLGLRVRDDPAYPGQTLVSWILPGPLEGKGWTSPTMVRGDVLLAVNGAPMTEEQFRAFTRAARAGDEVVLRVRRTEGKIYTGVPTPGSGTREEDVPVVLPPAELWTGPILEVRPRPDLSGVVPLPEATPARGGAGLLEAFIEPYIHEHQQVEALSKLKAVFARWLDDNYGSNMLSRVAFGFAYPTRVVELERHLTAPLAKLRANPRAIFAIAAENLDLPAPEISDGHSLSDPAAALAWLGQRVEAAGALVEQALANLSQEERQALPDDLAYLMEQNARHLLVDTHADGLRSFRVLRLSLKVDHAKLLQAAAELAGAMVKSAAPPAETPPVPLPEELRDIVEGEILAALRVGERWLVYGGAGPNVYDMSKLAGVIDAGGDDEYRYGEEARTPARGRAGLSLAGTALPGIPGISLPGISLPGISLPGVRVVIDLAGNDRHVGAPAAGWAGVSVLVDYEGDDVSESRLGGCGAGVLGVGILLDYAGADTYRGARWSVGAGFYGLGAVLDLGGHGDVYESEQKSQGIGGPRGFGLLYDAGGSDYYRANGPVKSHYDVPAVFSSFSQGVGLGLRGSDTGGVGVLYDAGGADRYEAGEFAQGCGYAWGLGILHDANGRDVYVADRYSQGSGCHQAIGILADDAGDDTYWAKTAASQGGAWDIAIGLLIDRAGDDAYRADGLSLGSAAQQAIGLFLDLGGRDHYNASPTRALGAPGGNEYHYYNTGALSWSLFLDAGSGDDRYPQGRGNNQVLAPGAFKEDDPQQSNLHGLFIDSEQPLKLDP